MKLEEWGVGRAGSAQPTRQEACALALSFHLETH